MRNNPVAEAGMRLFATVVALALLAGCAAPPRVAPMPVEEARAVRQAVPPGSLVLLLAPPRPVAGAGPALEMPQQGAIAVALGGEHLTNLHPSEALVIPPGGPRRFGVRSATLVGPWSEHEAPAGRTVFLTLDTGPSGSVSVSELPPAEGSALLAARMLVRPGAVAIADPPRAALRPLPDAEAADAVAAGAIPAGRGRLLVAAGVSVNARQGAMSLVPINMPARGDVVVEGVAVASIEPPEVLALDLPPGTYAMHWRHRLSIYGERAGPELSSPLPRAVEIRAGQVTALSADLVDARGLRIVAAGGLVSGTPGGFFVTRLVPVDAAALLGGGARLVVPPPATLAGLTGASAPRR
jgi:hypothetical protein